MRDIPWIVCLCGSTRFKDRYDEENRRLTLEGKIVLTCGLFLGSGDTCTPEQEAVIKKLHLRKIDLADEVRIVNPGGYIGDSTRHETEYALNAGKLVTWLDDMPGTQAVCQACGYVGYVDVGQLRAHLHFRRLGWKSVPRMQDGHGGYILCPSHADAPEAEIQAAREAR